MRVVAALLSLLLPVKVALAVDTKELAVCTTEKDSVKRLACFDALANKAEGGHQKGKIVGGKGKWRVSSSTSPVDDSKTVVLRLNANNSVSNAYKTSIPTLILRCQERDTEAYVTYEMFIDTEEAWVTYRFDKNKAEEGTWGVSSDHEALFIPRAISFIKTLLQSETLFVRVTPYGEGPVSVSFDLRGLSQVIGPLQAACGWTTP